MTRQVAVQACTRRSRRHEDNEDRASVGADVLADATAAQHWTLPVPALVAAFDGVGGAPHGAVASDLAARTLSAAEVPLDETAATDLLHRADRLLLDAGEVDLLRKGMATTAAVLIVPAEEQPAMIVNVGDTLVARLAADGLEELTVSDRIHGGIFQSLGGHDNPDMRPHVRSVELAPGDRLLLATDGLTDVVAPEVVAQVLREEREAPTTRLLELVEEAGVPDDVTIMVVDLQER